MVSLLPLSAPSSLRRRRLHSTPPCRRSGTHALGASTPLTLKTELSSAPFLFPPPFYHPASLCASTPSMPHTISPSTAAGTAVRKRARSTAPPVAQAQSPDAAPRRSCCLVCPSARRTARPAPATRNHTPDRGHPTCSAPQPRAASNAGSRGCNSHERRACALRPPASRPPSPRAARTPPAALSG